MRFIRTLLWTGVAVGFGIFLGSAELGGHTPLQHLEGLWRTHVGRSHLADDLRDGVEGVVDRAKGALGQDVKPREVHTPGDREALHKLIVAKRAAR